MLGELTENWKYFILFLSRNYYYITPVGYVFQFENDAPEHEKHVRFFTLEEIYDQYTKLYPNGSKQT